MSYYSMASSALRRTICISKTFWKCSARRFSATGKRCLLSAEYTSPKIWEEREQDPQSLAELATLMDSTYDRKLPVSSLTISRFVDNISSSEEVTQAEYYLYKFRHSPNCWYLRDWTIHSWIRHCLKYGAREKALYSLKNKVQFGIFPDNFTFNLLLDSFLKDKDYKAAWSVVEEIMFQEAFELPSTQILSLYTLAHYLATKPELTWEEERNLGAALLIAGKRQQDSVGFSAQLLGCSFIGKVEMSRGFRAVFRSMPLMWTPGYLSRALSVMEKTCIEAQNVKLSKEAVDYLAALLLNLNEAKAAEGSDETKADETGVEEEDLLERTKVTEYASRFKELRSKLESLGRIHSSSLQALTQSLAEETLSAAEIADVQQYRRTLQTWAEERHQLIHREKELHEKARQEQQARAAEKAKQLRGRQRHG